MKQGASDRGLRLHNASTRYWIIVIFPVTFLTTLCTHCVPPQNSIMNYVEIIGSKRRNFSISIFCWFFFEQWSPTHTWYRSAGALYSCRRRFPSLSKILNVPQLTVTVEPKLHYLGIGEMKLFGEINHKFDNEICLQFVPLQILQLIVWNQKKCDMSYITAACSHEIINLILVGRQCGPKKILKLSKYINDLLGYSVIFRIEVKPYLYPHPPLAVPDVSLICTATLKMKSFVRIATSFVKVPYSPKVGVSEAKGTFRPQKGHFFIFSDVSRVVS